MYTRWIAAPVFLSIFFSVFSCGGGLAHALSTTMAVEPSGVDPQSTPAVASNGSTMLTAWAQSGGVYAARIDTTTGAILDATPMRLATSTASEVDVASVGSGFLVVWSAGAGVSAATVSDAGVAAPSVTVSSAGSDPAVTAGTSSYLVTWVDAGQVEATVLDAAANSLTNGGFVVSADGAHPTAASNGSAFLLSWVSMTTAELRAQRFSATGQPIDAAPIVVSSTPIAAAQPSATYTSSGYFIAWEDARGADVDIYGAFIDASGLLGSPIPISTAPGDQTRPSAAGAGSTATIAFVSGGAVHVNRYDGTLLISSASSTGSALSTATPAGSPDVTAWSGEWGAAWVQQDRVWARSPVAESPTQPGTIGLAQSAVTIGEAAGSVTVSVERTDGADGAVTVSYATTAGSAAAGADFVARSGSISWADGDAEPKSIELPVFDDGAVEGDETFDFALSGPTGGAQLGESKLTVTIEDDDSASPGTLAFRDARLSVLEDGGQLVVTVVRAGGGDGEASVEYHATGGTASASDYSGAAGTLVWAPGQTGAMSFVLDVVDDAVFEGDETIELALRAASGADIGTPATATVTIADDDDALRGTVGFVMTSHSADETQGALQLAVTRTGGADGPVSVRYRTQDISAVEGSDYDAATGVLTWADGDATTKVIPLELHDDLTREGSESFAVSLYDFAGGATPGNATALVTISDDEGPSYGSLGVASDTLTVPEAADSIEIAVSRTGGSHGIVSVDYTTRTVSATPTTDYDETSGTLAWGDGDDEDKFVRIEIHDDSDFDPGEAFQLELSRPTGGAALGAPAATVTITDDEIAIPGLLSFVEPEYTATEEEALVTLFVARTGGDGEVTVKYDTLAESAGNGDYTSVSGRMRWADGDVSLKRIDIPVTQDSEFEKDETFSVVLSEVTGGAAIDRGSALVTILDDDEAVDPGTDPDPDPNGAVGTVGFVEEAVTATESAGKISILVERADGSAGAAQVDWAAVGGTALAATDFEEGSGTLTWAAGESGTKEIEITVIDDDTAENEQQFQVTLTNPSDGLELDRDTLTIALEDDDGEPVDLGRGGDDGGCGGCATGPGSASDLLPLLVLVGLVVSRRRRRRRI